MKTNHYKKLMSSALSASLATGALVSFVPQADAASQQFTDVRAQDYFFEAVKDLSSRDILKGYEDKTFRPYQSLTRAQAAKIIALTLDMNTKDVKNPGFTDVSTKHWSYGYVAALTNAGIIKGYGDQFRPNEPLTRAQMAKIITLSFQFKSGTLEESPFKDVKKGDWFAEFVTPLIEKQITTGTTPTTFSPNKAVSRGQMASFIFRSENAVKPAAVKSTVINITNQELVLESGTYQLTAEMKKWLNPSNLAALKGAEISLTAKEGQAEKIQSVELTAKGASSSDASKPYENHLLLDGKGEVIDTSIVVNGDYIMLKNATIKGDLHIGKGVANSFYADGVKVEGKTVIADEAKAAKQQTSKFYKELSYTTYVNRFQTVAEESNGKKASIIFNNATLGQVEANQSGITLEANGTTIIAAVSLAGEITFTAGDNAVIPRLIIAAGVQNVTINADVAEIIVMGNQSITINGNGNFGKVTASDTSTVSVQTTGTVGALEVADKYSRFILGNSTRVNNLILPAGTTPQEAITNYNNVKNNVEQIGGVKNPDITPPSSGGGGSAPASVKLVDGSLGTAGNGRITALETGKLFKVTIGTGTGTAVKYVKADGTLTDNIEEIASLTGTSITGLTNGKSYKVEKVSEEEVALQIAIAAVAKAEASNIQADVDAAKSLVTALSNNGEKSALNERLDAVQARIDAAKALADAIAAVVAAETSKTQTDVNTAQGLVTALPSGVERNELQDRINIVQVSINADNALQAVLKAEDSKLQADVAAAKILVNALPDDNEPATSKLALLARLHIITAPVISEVSFKSITNADGDGLVTTATDEDTIEVTFTSDRQVTKLGNFKINGSNPNAFNEVANEDGTYTYTATHKVDAGDNVGPATFQINVESKAGIYSLTVETTTDNSSVQINRIP